MARLQRLLIFVSSIVSSHQLDLKGCNADLGMESGEIPDSAITATSSFDPARVGPQHSRLNVERDGGAWCPEPHITKGIREYLEVDLHTVRVITAVSVQGRFGNGNGVEFADNFTLEYMRPGLTAWRNYRRWDGHQILPGNANHYMAVRRELWPPIVATRIRLLPFSIYARTVCMRLELHGCNKTDGVTAYSAPQGESRWPGVELTDRTYDGAHNQGQLYGGLGQLNDGAYGADNFRQDRGHGRGFEWVAWRNTTADGALEMTFEFDGVRNFSAVVIHTNADQQKGVEVFSQVRVTGSVGGRYFNTGPVVFYTLGGGVFHARNVTVPLKQLLARHLRLQLTFASDWLLVSEVTFISEPAEGNFTAEITPLLGDQATAGGTLDSAGRQGVSDTEEGGLSSEHLGLIGALSSVILVLVLVILYIVHRVRAQRAGQVVSQLAPNYAGRLTQTDNGKAALGEQYAESGYRAPYSAICEKYGEPLSPGHYAEYQSQEYAEPLMNTPPPLPPVTNSPLSSVKRGPLANNSPKLALEKPCSPQLSRSPRLKHSPRTAATFRSDSSSSPILEHHYAATDICKPADLVADPHNFPLEEVEVPQIDRHQLQLWEKLGDGQFGEVHLCRIEGAGDRFPDVVGNGGRSLVAVKSLRPGSSQTARSEFEREVQTLSRLQDTHIVRVLGVCSREEPFCMVVEYLEHGDLNQYLQQHVAESAGTAHPQAKILSYGSLIYMATQISSGMKYLESLNFVHRDLATRNCLVGRGHKVKISDFGMSRSVYANDYYKVEGRTLLPIRWMAWESIFLGKFTTKSDVWSFAVTLWEVLTYARQQPFEEMSDERVIETLAQLYHDDSHQVCLPQPHDCPREIYDLLLECWRREPRDRPNFREIHLFLQRKNLGYRAGTVS